MDKRVSGNIHSTIAEDVERTPAVGDSIRNALMVVWVQPE